MTTRYQRSVRALLPLAAAIGIAACGGSGGSNGYIPVVATNFTPPAQSNVNSTNPVLAVFDNAEITAGGGMTMVWNDEFDGTSIDTSKWFFETGDGSQYGFGPGGGGAWGNNELQYYLPDSAQVANGVLSITARDDGAGGYSYTSARINTRDRVAVRYGRVEASIKLPAGQGYWPAFWLLGQDSPYGEWAATGEIDIVEAVNLDGTGGNEIFGTIHYGGEFPANLRSETRYTPSTDVTDDFHTYAVEWDAGEIRWYVDGTLYGMQNSWSSTAAAFPAPFDQPFYILLNLAVGGNFPGSPNAATSFPAVMEVDYVRIYSGTP